MKRPLISPIQVLDARGFVVFVYFVFVFLNNPIVVTNLKPCFKHLYKHL